MQFAVWTLLGFMGYLRPKENFALQGEDLVPPMQGMTSFWAVIVCSKDRGLVSKVGVADDSVLLDTPFLQFLNPVWALLHENRRGRPLWDFEYREMLTAFVQSGRRVGVEAVPYQLRHSGPAWDPLRKLRTQEEVMKRGRWKALSSLARYECHARVAAEMSALPAEPAHHCRVCADRLEDYVLRGTAPAPPPAPLTRAST